MEKCDVLVVGGGPAGSSCARKLVRAGLDVLVMDKKAFPRNKTCAGWITPAVIEELQIDVDDYARSRVLQPITGFRTGMIGGQTVESHYAEPVSFGIRRCEFDAYLLERCGARLRLGEALTTLERSADGWIANGEIAASMVVGAGGHFCPVARFLNGHSISKKKPEQVVAAQEIEFEMTAEQMAASRVRPEVPELYFCEDLKGYAWCFRKGPFLNVGLGREDNHRLSEQMKEFCDLMKSTGRIPFDISDRFQGHAYILYGHEQREMIDDGVLLVGDAVGLAFPESGEGIRPAVESGMIAADVILAAKSSYHKAQLQSYEEQLVRRFGRRQNGRGFSAILPASFKTTIAHKLLATHWFSRRVVIDRWFLHRHQAALPSQPLLK